MRDRTTPGHLGRLASRRKHLNDVQTMLYRLPAIVRRTDYVDGERAYFEWIAFSLSRTSVAQAAQRGDYHPWVSIRRGIVRTEAWCFRRPRIQRRLLHSKNLS